MERQVEIKPLTVSEWLKVSYDDKEFIKLPRAILEVSLLNGIPNGMRCSIWT
jgi:hypothetical protein